MVESNKIAFDAVLRGLNRFISGVGAMDSVTVKFGKNAAKTTQQLSQLGVTFQSTAQGGGQFQSNIATANTNLKTFVKTTEILTRIQKQARAEMNLLGAGFDRASTRIQRASIRLRKAQREQANATKEAEEAIKEWKVSGASAEGAIQKLVDSEQQLVLAENELTAAVVARAKAQAAAAAKTPTSGAQTIAAFKDIKKYGSMVIGVLSKLALALGVVAIASKAVSVALNIIKGALRLLLSPITRAWGAFKNLFKTALAVAFGVLIRDTIRNIIRTLRDLVTAAGDAVKFFQNLGLRLANFENRLLRLVDPTLTFETAAGQAEERAKGLIEVIKRLSLTIPFSTEVIGNTLSLNLAMGFTEKTSISLTKSIAAFTAGMGLTSEIMERIVFNFGQMKQAGKITGTELRDLARGAFLPITEIMGETAKVQGLVNETIERTKELAGEGAIPVEAFFEAFEIVVAKNFPDALERFSKTLDGVTTRFRNFMQTIVGLEVLGPIMQRITRMAADALDRLLVPSVQRAARLMGESLNKAFGVVTSAIRVHLIPALKDLWGSFGEGEFTIENVIRFVTVRLTAFFLFIGKGIHRVSDWIKKMADNNEAILKNHAASAFAWGYNIIAMLARGMVSAASLVIRALTVIANIIASLLRAFSPPKLLPDLPEWGMNAMASYLRGFLMADFDILKGIQDPVKNALDILEQTGKIAANSAGKIYADISKAIAKALSGGGITEGLFSRIEGITGPFGEEIGRLARRQVELAAATKAVQDAEERLERARKSHEAARIKTNRLIREYNTELRAGADPSFLKSKLAEINATEKSAQAAYQEQKAAESSLESKEGLLKIVQEQLKLQEELVKQLIELTRAQIIIPELDAGGGGAGDALADIPIPNFDDIFSDLGLGDDPAFLQDLDDIMKEAEALAKQWALNMEGFWDDIGIGKLGEEFTGLQTAIENLGVAYKTGGVIEELISDFGRVKDAIVAAGDALDGMFGAGKRDPALLDSWQRVGKTSEEISGMGGLGQLTILLGDLTSSAIIGGLALLVGHIQGLADAFVSVSEGLSGIASSWNSIKESWGIMGDTAEKVDETDLSSWQNFFGVVGTQGANINEQFFGIAEFAKALTPGGITDTLVSGFVDGVRNYFAALGIDIPAELQFMLDLMNTIVGFELNEVIKSVGSFVLDWLKELLGMKDETVGNSIIPDMMDAMYDIITGTLGDIQTFWDEKWQAIYDFFNDTFVTPVQEAIDGTLTDLDNFINDTLGPTLEWLTLNVLDPLTEGWEAVNGVLDTFATLVGEAWAALEKIPANIIAWLIGNSPSPLAIGISSISDAIAKLAAQAVPQAAAATSTAAAASPVMSSSNSVNVNMGGVAINNGMDEALFEARVLNIVQRGLRI